MARERAHDLHALYVPKATALNSIPCSSDGEESDCAYQGVLGFVHQLTMTKHMCTTCVDF